MRSPLFIAIVLTATALGVVVPLLTDAGKVASTFGQIVIAAASLADFGTVVLLSLFFSRATTSSGARVILLGGFVVLTLLIALAILRIDRSRQVRRILVRLQDTTAQIRMRGAFLLLAAFVALAQGLGLEVILGAFTAGAVLRFIDRDAMITHPQFRQKLAAAGFGIFIPIFFITSGMQLNLHAVFAHTTTTLLVPTFLLALLLVRGLPALLYAPLIGKRQVLPAGLLQATSLSFLVTAAQIGIDLGIVTAATATALIMAGVLSVLLFPTVALRVLGNTAHP